MARSIVKVGRLSLTESEFRIVSSNNEGNIEIGGIESTPYIDAVASRKLHHDIRGLIGKLVPVIFQDKTGMNGYYLVADATDDIDWWKQGASTHEWKINLTRVGEDSEIDLESRLSGALSRINDHSVVGERWNAPPGGHTGYFTGSTAPNVLIRATEDGSLIIYRNIPISVFPRWSCSLASYPLGRVRFIDDLSRERTGVDFEKNATIWTLTNGIIRVRISPGTGVFEIASWQQSTTSWITKNWDLQVNAVTLGKLPISCNIIRNDYEVITIRLTWNISPSGRTQTDITLRRGSRFAEFFVSYPYSATIKFVLATAAAGTVITGGLRSTANDASGNRYVIGSLKSFTGDLTNGGISKAAATVFDAFIGIEQAGSSAVAGDQAADLVKQYVGVASERVVGFRR